MDLRRGILALVTPMRTLGWRWPLLFAIQMACASMPTLPQQDVERLVRSAEQLADRWPAQPPPPVPEVAAVARHGTRAVPLLMPLLTDDPDAERNVKQWKVQQQASLALCRIYAQCHCGRVYCDDDPPERIARIKEGWSRVIAEDAERRALSIDDLVDRFKAERVSWRQRELAESLAERGDRRIVAELEPRLMHDDRHLRGNVALVLGRLGDPRGFDTIAAILADYSPRGEGQGLPGGKWGMRAQIAADRYYAAHLLGGLKDPRAVDLLIPLLDDRDLRSVVPWALAQIGDPRAIPPLLAQLDQDDASARMVAIYALEHLNAHEALPRLGELLLDERRANFGDAVTVAEAARRALAVLSSARSRPATSAR